MDAAQTKALLAAAMNARWGRPLGDWLAEEGFDQEAFEERFMVFGEAAHPVGPELAHTLSVMSASFTMGWEARKLVETQR